MLIVIVLTLLLVHYVGQRTVVIGRSMENTLSNGDSLIVDKLSYRFRDPERFEVIVFPFKAKVELEPGHTEKTFYIKRIIGLPGETIRIDTEGHIYINGKLLDEHYGAEVIENPGTAINELTMGPDEYFVLGDNRNNSSDSRNALVGMIHRENIVGRAFVRIFPLNKIGMIGP